MLSCNVIVGQLLKYFGIPLALFDLTDFNFYNVNSVLRLN